MGSWTPDYIFFLETAVYHTFLITTSQGAIKEHMYSNCAHIGILQYPSLMREALGRYVIYHITSWFMTRKLNYFSDNC